MMPRRTNRFFQHVISQPKGKRWWEKYDAPFISMVVSSCMSPSFMTTHRNISVKAILSPQEGGLFKFGQSRGGGLLERGTFIQNHITEIQYIWQLFSSFTPYFVDSTYNLTSQLHEFNTFSIPNTIKSNMQDCLAKYMKNRCSCLEFDVSGGGAQLRGRLV